MLTLGMVLYNEILVVKWFGFDRYTRKRLAENEKNAEKKKLLEERRESEYVGTDDMLGFDAQR